MISLTESVHHYEHSRDLSSPLPTPDSINTMPSTSSATPLLPPALTAASTHLHTVSLLSSLALRLPDLIASPGLTLTRTALPLAALQTVYLVLTSTCTTPATPKTTSTTASTGPKHKKTPRAKKNTSIPVAILTSLLFAVAVGAPFLFLLLVAFGAPATSHHVATLSTAVHLALLTIYPLTFTRGWDASKWREVLALTGVIDEALVGALGACLGAWAGAIPIPLGRFFLFYHTVRC